MFSASLYTIAKCWKQPKCPSVVEQTKKPWFIYTMAYYAPEKKEGVPTFCNSIHRTRDYYAKGNEPVGEGQIPHDLESNEQNKRTRKTEPETWKQETRLAAAR